MMDALFFFFYRNVFAPIAIFALKTVRPFLKGKIRDIVDQRSNPQWPTLSARPILLHAASGEVEYAKPVLRELKHRYPQIPILLTYFSPSALRLISDLHMVDMVWPLPFDGKVPMSRFLSKVRPRMVLFARTDVWPEMVYECRKLDIPTYLFSATLAENSSRLRFPARHLSRFALNQLSGIFCVSEEDRQVLSNLGVRAPTEVLGDSRFDQVQFRLQNPKTLKNIFKSNHPQKVFIIGSSWEQDEEELLTALQHLDPKLFQSIRIIWAPHEVSPHHLNSLRERFAEKNWPYVNYSQILREEEWRQILLIDQVGILADLYRHAGFAFVGGSFKDKVHSVMEPLMTGLPVAVGPFHQNNREALKFREIRDDIHGRPLVTVTSSAEQLLQYLEDQILQPASTPDVRSKVLESAGATQSIVQRVAQSLESQL